MSVTTQTSAEESVSSIATSLMARESCDPCRRAPFANLHISIVIRCTIIAVIIAMSQQRDPAADKSEGEPDADGARLSPNA
jgi:uncharacterized membrane protein